MGVGDDRGGRPDRREADQPQRPQAQKKSGERTEMRGRNQTHRDTPKPTAQEFRSAHWVGNRRLRFEQIGRGDANGRVARRSMDREEPGQNTAKTAAPTELTRFSCFSCRSGTLIAFPFLREAVRIGLALPEKPEPSRFQTSTPTGKRAGLGCNLPGRAPLLPVGYLASLGEVFSEGMCRGISTR